MTDTATIPPIEQLRQRERALELEAYAIAAQIREVRALIALLEEATPRRGRPPRPLLQMHVGGAGHRPDDDGPGDAA